MFCTASRDVPSLFNAILKDLTAALFSVVLSVTRVQGAATPTVVMATALSMS